MNKIIMKIIQSSSYKMIQSQAQPIQSRPVANPLGTTTLMNVKVAFNGSALMLERGNRFMSLVLTPQQINQVKTELPSLNRM